ncbi:uncharacterized protein LY89DRAFT_686272 [Mollisia scopiformis]|uniref:Uncharacterized protein n=1 Tax=Mollisia scopiformis TaxID=149040 RepID=A0A194X654_MOLSC|nr:uncharacterized protein LY89DRAFT_686272 [Mollisia scopiformis]KUJ15544.1 hypothetical protein LY89DRAFT_686272 [Mollisia scopiformis]
MSAFPPHRLGASVPINQEIALKFLSKYLEAAKTSPHLLPNAKLDPSGPTAGSSSSSVTIHNLQRVEAGLRGEWLAPTLDLEESVPVAEGMDDGVNQGQGAQEEEEGWMDLDDYQREQSIDGGDIEDGPHVVVRNGEDSDLEVDRAVVNEVEGEDEEDAPVVKTPKKKKNKKTNGVAKPEKPLDKAARNKAKKQRLKEEQKLRAQSKQKAAT